MGSSVRLNMKQMQAPSCCWPLGNDLIKNCLCKLEFFEKTGSAAVKSSRKPELSMMLEGIKGTLLSTPHPRRPYHTTLLAPNLRHQKPLSKELREDAAIFWDALSAELYAPLSKCACQGMTLVPPWVRSPVIRHMGDSSLQPLGPNRPALALSNNFYTE